ncbi:F-box and WD repeat domain containing protein 10B isoform X2 [Heptranchias perlo]|uniref:F-box and WD repeat domain containing protein 10B isoform X2 n=1 Tax=Heptranchias perlo TaxID=212740 RepID=UPI00355AB2E4
MTMYDLDAGGEVSEFNIYSASNQTCLTGDCSAPPCGSCYTCTLELRLVSARQWFPRTGDLSKQQFLTGLIRRIGSLDLLQQVDRLLQPTLGKDFTHSRSRSNPSLPEDMSTLSSDRALNKVALRKYIFETWEWFANSRYWTKANYMLGLLQMCDVKLLHVIGNLIRTLLLRNKIPDFREAKGMDHDDDNISLNESIYSFKTDEHPELQQLAEIWPEYTIVSPATAPNSLIVQPAQVAASAKSHQAKTGLATKKKHSPRWKVDEDVHTEIEHPAAIIVTTSFQATSGVTHYKDFLRCLPVNLAKFILGFLNKKTLKNCMSVSCHWCYLAKDITRDQLALQCIFNDVMKLQGTAPQNVSIVYANICYIAVPRVDDKGFVFPTQNLKEKLGLEASYSGILTDLIQMEERNIYCGPYNIIVINKHPDPNRVIHYSGGQMVASGSSDRKIRFLDINRTKDISLIIQGHAGSIKALLLCEKRGFVLSGSYDLSIRRWNLKSGSCMNIYRGHTGFITCLKMHKDKFVSAAMDFQAKVWNLEKGKCICSFKHEKPVLSVAISEMYVVSSCEKGLVHVWNIAPPSLVKVLTGHRGPVTCVSFDQWHLVSGSKDGSVMAWSMIGNFSQCLMAFYHPQWVLCVHLLYLRVISGCRDGKIRIFDLRNGNCLRVMRANGRGDPVLSLNLAENRIVINTISNVVQFYFEEITWDYTAPSPIITNIMQQDPFKMAPLRKQPYSYVRAQRMRRIGSTNEKIYHKKENVTEQGLSHHARFLSTRYMQAAQRIQSDSMKLLNLRAFQHHHQNATHIDLQSELPSKPSSTGWVSRSSEMLSQESLR